MSNEAEPGQLPPEAHTSPAPNSAQAAATAEAHSRRAFLFKVSLALNGIVGAVLAVPILGYILGPAFRKTSSYNSLVSLGPVSQFPVGETRLADFVNPVTAPSDGATAKVACWVRRVDQNKFQVFAINCAHLGCPVRWFAQSKLFMCPCHGGAYYENGERASGPPERGLFEYDYTIDGQNLMINAGAMPTLGNKACVETPRRDLIQIKEQQQDGPQAAAEMRSDEWQA